MTSRPLEQKDFPMLQQALDNDKFEHATVNYYMTDDSYSEVYETGSGPVGVLRYSKIMRLVAVFCDNDSLQNAKTVIKMVSDACARAKSSGYTEIIFNTQSEKLANFCTQRLGFVKSNGEFVKIV